ncbi:methylglyoxal reductase (NADPH-dependent) gre2 [Pestalotiopsis sp. IQ-011]
MDEVHFNDTVHNGNSTGKGVMKEHKGDYWKAGDNWIVLYVFLTLLPMIVIGIFVYSHILYRRQQKVFQRRVKGAGPVYILSRPLPFGSPEPPTKKQKVTLLHRWGQRSLKIRTDIEHTRDEAVRGSLGKLTVKSPVKAPSKSPIKID